MQELQAAGGSLVAEEGDYLAALVPFKLPFGAGILMTDRRHTLLPGFGAGCWGAWDVCVRT